MESSAAHDGEREMVKAMYSEQPDRTPEFFEASALVAENLDRLESEVARLGEKLLPISSHGVPSEARSPGQDTRFQSPVAQTIEGYAMRLRRLADQVGETASRVEV